MAASAYRFYASSLLLAYEGDDYDGDGDGDDNDDDDDDVNGVGDDGNCGGDMSARIDAATSATVVNVHMIDFAKVSRFTHDSKGSTNNASGGVDKGLLLGVTTLINIVRRLLERARSAVGVAGDVTFNDDDDSVYVDDSSSKV
jgi:hypothetical protein